MDASNKKVSVIAEVTQGTTPATPGFLVLRDTMTTGGLAAPWTESPERRSDRMLGTTVKGLHALTKKISMPLAVDAAVEVLLSSFMCNSWATNVLKNASTIQSITLEEIQEAGGVTPGPWVQSKGCVVDQMGLTLTTGKEGELVFDLLGMTETTGSSSIAGSTYAAPSVYEPITPIDIVVNSFFSLTPKMTSLSFTAKNNLRPGYNWGSPNIYRTGLGAFRVDVQAVFYFDALAQYTAISAGALGTLDITMGADANHKYQLVLPNAKISNPVISDGGNSTDVSLSCTLSALYDSGSGAAMTITRLVA